MLFLVISALVIAHDPRYFYWLRSHILKMSYASGAYTNKSKWIIHVLPDSYNSGVCFDSSLRFRTLATKSIPGRFPGTDHHRRSNHPLLSEAPRRIIHERAGSCVGAVSIATHELCGRICNQFCRETAWARLGHRCLTGGVPFAWSKFRAPRIDGFALEIVRQGGRSKRHRLEMVGCVSRGQEQRELLVTVKEIHVEKPVGKGELGMYCQWSVLTKLCRLSWFNLYSWLRRPLTLSETFTKH